MSPSPTGPLQSPHVETTSRKLSFIPPGCGRARRVETEPGDAARGSRPRGLAGRASGCHGPSYAAALRASRPGSAPVSLAVPPRRACTGTRSPWQSSPAWGAACQRPLTLAAGGQPRGTSGGAAVGGRCARLWGRANDRDGRQRQKRRRPAPPRGSGDPPAGEGCSPRLAAGTRGRWATGSSCVRAARCRPRRRLTAPEPRRPLTALRLPLLPSHVSRLLPY